MPWYGFIHPILAVGTMYFGVRVAQVSMSRVLEWDFPLRKQRVNSIIFFLLCVANLVVGYVANAAMGEGDQVKLTLHVPMAFAVVILSALAGLVTFTRSRKPGEVSGPMKIHHWLIFIPAVIILAMGMTGLLALFGI
jgi:hypothetical protein